VEQILDDTPPDYGALTFPLSGYFIRTMTLDKHRVWRYGKIPLPKYKPLTADDLI